VFVYNKIAFKSQYYAIMPPSEFNSSVFIHVQHRLSYRICFV